MLFFHVNLFNKYYLNFTTQGYHAFESDEFILKNSEKIQLSELNNGNSAQSGMSFDPCHTPVATYLNIIS